MANRLTNIIITTASCLGVLAQFVGQRAAAQDVKIELPKLVDRVDYSFRDGVARHDTLNVFGDENGLMTKVEPQGLRFNVPPQRNFLGDIGVESKLRLKGDFEVTLEYELLTLPDPAPELGAGVFLQVLLDTPDQARARMGRSRKALGPVFGANYITRKPDDKEDDFKGLVAQPAIEKAARGHLRMTRVGAMLSYQVEEGGAAFRTIATKEVGRADVLAVKIGGHTGWKPLALEIRFPRLELRAAEIPDKAHVPPALAAPMPAPIIVEAPVLVAEANSGSRITLLIMLVIAGFLSMALLVGLVLFMGKRGDSKTPATPKAAREPGPGNVVIACPECGKKFKVQAKLAGKKVKCGECGTAVLIEAEE